MRFFSVILNVVAFFAPAYTQTPLTTQFFKEGTRAAQDRQFEKAMASYKKALLYTGIERENDDSFRAKIHSNIGICLYRLERYQEAIVELDRSIDLSDGKYQRAFYAIGMTQIELNNRKGAIEAFREAVRLKPDDAEAWFDLASVLVLSGDYPPAAEAFEHSIKHRTAASPHAHNNLGVLLALSSKFSAAEAEFKIAMRESDGALTEARNNLQFCRSYKQKSNQPLVGSLEFSAFAKAGRSI